MRGVCDRACRRNLVKWQIDYTFAGEDKGKMAEWSIAAVLKTVDLQGSGGSNPSLSASTTAIATESNSVAFLFGIRLPLQTAFADILCQTKSLCDYRCHL